MKIYNKNISDIFKAMTWPQKFLILVGSIFVLCNLFYVPYTLFTFEVFKKENGPLNLISQNKIYNTLDPSIASDGENTYMAFTHLSPNALLPSSQITEIKIARSTKATCQSFIVRNTALIGYIEDVIGPDHVTPLGRGTWQFETPSLIYDPKDTKAPWKIFAYKYFWMNNAPLAKLYSMIIISTAQDPLGEWSKDIWFFGTSDQSPPAPYNDMVVYKLNDLHPSLKNITSYARPSVVLINDVLVMSVSAYTAKHKTPDRIVMFASPDHGRTWRYLGTPLTHQDMVALGYKSLSGVSLLKQGEEILLAVTGGNTQFENAGTVIMAFETFAKGLLKRQDEKPVILQTLPLQSIDPAPFGGGFAAYHDACGTGGLITSEASGVTGHSTLFHTYIRPREK